MEIHKSVPIHFQIEIILRNSILRGEYEPNAQLPTEAELSKQYGVSRIPIRQALATLENDGIIYRKQGKGTFVSSNVKKYETSSLMEYIHDGSYPRGEGAKVIDFTYISATGNIAKRLGLQEGSKICRIERLRSDKAGPISHIYNFIPGDICSKIKPEFLVNTPMLTVLKKKLKINVVRIKQTITASIADGYVATMLNIRFGEPIMVLQRTYFDDHDVPVQYALTALRGDKYSYEVDLYGNTK